MNNSIHAASQILTFEEQLTDGELNMHTIADASGQLLENALTLARLVQVLSKEHLPVPTGREEHVLDSSDPELPHDKRPVLGTAPTYRCATFCETRHFFANDGCHTWRLLDGHFDLESLVCND